MSENNPKIPEGLASVTIDHSMDAFPASFTEAYELMNDSIASERAEFGPTLQREHLEVSRYAIWATANTALSRATAGSTNKAIILGAGGCFDIPVEEIVTEFDATTLVDIDTQHTERALSDLPARLLGKVSLVKADITGGVAEFAEALKVVDEESSYERFVEAAVNVVNGINFANNFGIGGEYSFVCSQLLMTQLSSIPIIKFENRIHEKYGRSVTRQPNPTDLPLALALNDFNLRNQAGHISHLARLTRNTGTVHFADTIAAVKEGRVLPMVTGRPFKEMSRYFVDLARPAIWQWQCTPERAFCVSAKSLAPKTPTSFAVYP